MAFAGRDGAECPLISKDFLSDLGPLVGAELAPAAVDVPTVAAAEATAVTDSLAAAAAKLLFRFVASSNRRRTGVRHQADREEPTQIVITS